jgi:hypothetical protein
LSPPLLNKNDDKCEPENKKWKAKYSDVPEKKPQ